MSPFYSKAQARAAFAGKLGPEMKKKAPQYAKETPNFADLPERSGKGMQKMMMVMEAERRAKK